MGKMVLSEPSALIEKHGFISTCDPACGSGAMILGFAHALSEAGYNYSTQLFAHATDIDIKCVHMCYLQLALYGIPAVVIHSDTLGMERWSHWFTPVYILHGWQWKLRRKQADTEDLRASTPKVVKPSKPPKVGEQMTLFEGGN